MWQWSRIAADARAIAKRAAHPRQWNITFNRASAFDDYMFVGGLDFATNSRVTFGPGRYVFAGVLNETGDVLSMPNGVTVNSTTGDAGRIFIYTDFRTGLQRQPSGTAADGYAGQMDAAYEALQLAYATACQGCPGGGTSWSRVSWANTGLRHGSVSIQSGNNAASSVSLIGLQSGHPDIPADLEPYAPVLMWQDQHNSYVKYTNEAQVDTSCGVSFTAQGSRAPELDIQASPFTSYEG
jgi:hypothetical protein